MTKPEQLKWFEAQIGPKALMVEPEKRIHTQKKSARGAPRRELIQLRGLLRNGHYDSQGNDWVMGATAVLDLVLDRKPMTEPDDLSTG